jgi:dipeptidase
MKVLISLVFVILAIPLFACTNLIISKGASKDGSAFLAYTNDAEYIYHLYTKPGSLNADGSKIKFRSRDGVEGEIDQVSQTYSTLGFHMNEHQLMIGETTFTGRLDLWDHSAFLEYWQLMQLALERAKNAREAIEVITSLVEEYGYSSEGESFSIVDPNEAWILEMIGGGNGSGKVVWVAVKIPDGQISAHANRARIGVFPLDDPENCLYSKNIIDLAIEKGFYKKSDGPFRFCDIYCPPECGQIRYAETRVWSMFRRAAPSLKLSPDYHRCVEGSTPYPLCIKPDSKIGLQDVFNLIRDHYEGTDFDMTKGLQAGPFGNPNHWRPLEWEYEEKTYGWERPVSTYNSAFTFVGQVRGHLPDSIGGIVWFGVDDSYFTCYVPLHHNIAEIPKPFTIGDINEFNFESAWWLFNLTANYCNLRYDSMHKDMKVVQQRLEKSFIAQNDSLEMALLQNPTLNANHVFTKFAFDNTKKMMKEWEILFFSLVVKYNDGYIKDESGKPKPAPYPNPWYGRIVEEDSSSYRIPAHRKPESEVKRAY